MKDRRSWIHGEREVNTHPPRFRSNLIILVLTLWFSFLENCKKATDFDQRGNQVTTQSSLHHQPKILFSKMARSKKNNRYIGRRIAREFDGQGIYHGTVDGFDAVYDLYHIAYDDGDAEEMNHTELLFAMDLFQGNSDRSYIGRRVSREFGRKVCDGTIDKFDSRRRLWKVAYDYGEVGEMDHREVLYAMDLFDDKAVALPVGRSKTKAAKSTRRVHWKKGNRGDDVQLFGFKSDEPAVKEEQNPGGRPRRKLKAIKRFDPLSYDPQAHCPTGHGFACPRCSSICSYDSRECEECYLECYYEAGVGVVVLKERQVGPLRSTTRVKNVGATAVASNASSLDVSPQNGSGSRKSVEDVTDLLLTLKKEAQQRSFNEAVEISSV